jgi:uncharacterized glyoxalase superfamily protein PhnB
MPGPDGKSTLHAEMRIGDSTLMFCDENPDWGTKCPQTLGGTPVVLHLYVEDADAVFNRAVAAGCEVTQQQAKRHVTPCHTERVCGATRHCQLL